MNEIRKYAMDDMVKTPQFAYATVIGFPSRSDPELAGIDAPGPLYLVNEGNVYDEAYEAIYPESELQPYVWTGPVAGPATGEVPF